MCFGLVPADYCYYDGNGVVLYVGGNYNQNRNHGPFYLNGNYAAWNSNTNIGSRLLVETRYFRIFGADFRTPLGEDFIIGIWASRQLLENP